MCILCDYSIYDTFIYRDLDKHICIEAYRAKCISSYKFDLFINRLVIGLLINAVFLLTRFKTRSS